MILTQEFHPDHQKVVAALFELCRAIAASAVVLLRPILERAEGLIGRCIDFEEVYRYPPLGQFIGDGQVKRLVIEKDTVFRGVRRVAEPTVTDAWSDSVHGSAQANLDAICTHPISPDGLRVWMERLSREEQKGLEQRMVEVRTDRNSAEANLDPMWEHPIRDDGLRVWMERLSRQEQEGLEQRLWTSRGLSSLSTIANVSAADVRCQAIQAIEGGQ